MSPLVEIGLTDLPKDTPGTPRDDTPDTGYYGFVFDFLSALMALPSHHVQPDFSRVLVALLVIGVVIAF